MTVWLGKAIQQRLKDQWITQWYGNIVTKSIICSNYVSFKNVFGREDYLLKLQTKARFTLVKLRTNNNRLPITVG